jgi:hypothetical protein
METNRKSICPAFHFGTAAHQVEGDLIQLIFWHNIGKGANDACRGVNGDDWGISEILIIKLVKKVRLFVYVGAMGRWRPTRQTLRLA